MHVLFYTLWRLCSSQIDSHKESLYCAITFIHVQWTCIIMYLLLYKLYMYLCFSQVDSYKESLSGQDSTHQEDIKKLKDELTVS